MLKISAGLVRSTRRPIDREVIPFALSNSSMIPFIANSTCPGEASIPDSSSSAREVGNLVAARSKSVP
jgi:hypothetical protein